MKSVEKKTILEYAVNIIILKKSQNEVRNSAKKLIETSHNMRLIVMETKTKYLVMSRKSKPKNNLKVNK